MNLEEALKVYLNRKTASTQNVDILISNINLDYNLPQREYEIVDDNNGVKYYKTVYNDKEYGIEIEIYFSIMKGSMFDDNYNNYSILVEEYLMGTRDYECISYSNYRLDGIVEKYKVYCDEEKSEETLLKRLDKLKAS